MAYDKQLETKFRHFKKRILDLEKASEAQDRALRQIADKLGIEIDLTPGPTAEEGSTREQETDPARRLAEDRELIALLEADRKEGE